VNVGSEDYIVKKDGTPFDKHDYYTNPHLYKSTFHQTILPYVKFLINCVYWYSELDLFSRDWRFPKLITIEQIQEMKKDLNLLFLSDISI
jgi:hypothetical protein